MKFSDEFLYVRQFHVTRFEHHARLCRLVVREEDFREISFGDGSLDVVFIGYVEKW